MNEGHRLGRQVHNGDKLNQARGCKRSQQATSLKARRLQTILLCQKIKHHLSEGVFYLRQKIRIVWLGIGGMCRSDRLSEFPQVVKRFAVGHHCIWCVARHALKKQTAYHFSRATTWATSSHAAVSLLSPTALRQLCSNRSSRHQLRSRLPRLLLLLLAPCLLAWQVLHPRWISTAWPIAFG